MPETEEPTLGEPLSNWTPPPFPKRLPMAGRYGRLEPLDPNTHISALFQAYQKDVMERGWAYLPYGPFDHQDQFEAWIDRTCLSDDPMFFAIIDGMSGNAVGLASYLNIHPTAGSIEVGHIHYSPPLQRTRLATEAMYLMMKHVFDLGYRRYEWKCNALNQASRNAALRLGFSFEGIFRQHLVVKQRNRDTAWYACIDQEWPDLRTAYETWLRPANFDDDGRQCQRLSDLTTPILKKAATSKDA